MDSNSEDWPWKYHPCEFDESEELEAYEPGGFHLVHLGDVYHGRYRVVHKLGFGGFSTVWLARDVIESRWVALKMVVARESATYEARATAANHPGIAGSPLFAVPEGRFWVDGPNGRHLCLVMPALGPNLSTLSKGIYSRVAAQFAREVSLQAARALAHLHANGLCHGGKTTYSSNPSITVPATS
jgi:serine/threonine protein kinase